MLFKSPGPVLTQINGWYQAAAATIGVNPEYTHHLTEYMTEAGFVDVDVSVYDIPIGEWPTTHCKFLIILLYEKKKKKSLMIGFII